MSITIQDSWVKTLNKVYIKNLKNNLNRTNDIQLRSSICSLIGYLSSLKTIQKIAKEATNGNKS